MIKEPTAKKERKLREHKRRLSSQLCRSGMTRVKEAECRDEIKREDKTSHAEQIYSRNAIHSRGSVARVLIVFSIKLEWAEGAIAPLYIPA